MAKSKKLGYEESLQKLEDILKKVENEEIPIDQLTELVKESMNLLKNCKSMLKGAEKEVDIAFSDLEE
ncbi:exodeoxyribonuclease VII small subunit [Marivirga harenae]|uniref:exodeoxyribonuclease VII small subunit n=1 Tax=Marivirga harenae TaxID=2010992 RepID=UPI0026DFDBB3|nr:exodeoxyribonuclease VII small subunit [Marivirga harenae]WKV11047.1 exodeoxyribonuclease VII small subunit [Marivirga harenae]|tara:strand:+ start:138955 stop:139158 length:204 start_codon:yes stop_codon:yes gene_type:complete